jgi:hypothetical protein
MLTECKGTDYNPIKKSQTEWIRNQERPLKTYWTSKAGTSQQVALNSLTVRQ